MNLNGLHYHNSLKSTDQSFSRYRPSTEIITEPLTNKYSVGEQIGRGKFAVVKKCTNIETKEVVAAKFIKKRRRGKTCREEILREVVMLEMALDHPRLVNLKEVYETQTELILITEYCAGGELFTECILDEKFSESDVKLLMSQIVDGLVYLHEKNIVHLDLKPQNILLTEPFPHGTVKICDLGFACLVNTGEDIRDIIGTPDYVAPEVLNYDPLGLYTDMWSLGVLTYVMLTQCSPFAGDDQKITFCNITTVQLDFPEYLFADISNEAQDFIKKLLKADPHERLTARECLQHPWLAGILSTSSSNLSVLESVSTNPGTSESSISLTYHSADDGEAELMIDSSDSNQDNTNKVDNKHRRVVDSSELSRDDTSMEYKKKDLIKLSSGKESLGLNMEKSKVQSSPVLYRKENKEKDDNSVENKSKDLGIFNPVKSERQSNRELLHSSMELSHGDDDLSNVTMEISFTDEDLTKENVCDSIHISEQNVGDFESDNIFKSKTALGNRSSSIESKTASTKFVESMSKLYKSVEIIVNNDSNDAEMASTEVIEVDLLRGGEDKQIISKGSNSGRLNFEKEQNEISSNSMKSQENPHKRTKCNDSSPTVMTAVNMNEIGETSDETNYEFISVSKRVRNYEQALTPQRSPAISPKSPRSPRIARLQRRSSHNSPYSS